MQESQPQSNISRTHTIRQLTVEKNELLQEFLGKLKVLMRNSRRNYHRRVNLSTIFIIPRCECQCPLMSKYTNIYILHVANQIPPFLHGWYL